MRAMNLSLPHRHTLRSHSWPIWPTTPTSPLPLSGWDDRGREPGEESEKQRHLPRLALQMWCVCLPGRNAAYARWTGQRDRAGFVSENELLAVTCHICGLWMAAGTSHLPRGSVRHTAVTQTFIRSERFCPVVSVSVRTVCG